MTPSSHSPLSLFPFTTLQSCHTSSNPTPILSWTHSNSVSPTVNRTCQGLPWPPHIGTANDKLSVLILPTLSASFDVTEHSFLLEMLFILDSQDTWCLGSPPTFLATVAQFLLVLLCSLLLLLLTVEYHRTQCSTGSSSLLQLPSLGGLIWAPDFECHLCTDSSQNVQC